MAIVRQDGVSYEGDVYSLLISCGDDSIEED